jgi:hypothetical protein
MSKTPRFGFDILDALNGVSTEYLTTPMTGPTDNLAEAHLLQLFTKNYCELHPRGTDDQGRPLPLPIVSDIRHEALQIEDSAHHDTRRSIDRRECFTCDQTQAHILWFSDGSGILFEEVADGYACLPVSLFLSKSGTLDEVATDVQAWLQAMRRMPEVLPHVDQAAIDSMTPDQCVAPWGNFSCNIYENKSSDFLAPVVSYAMLAKAHEVGPARITFTMHNRRINRDGTIGPAAVKITANGAQVAGFERSWFPEELQGIADHPDYPEVPWKMVNQTAGRTYAAGHKLYALGYRCSATIDTVPTAHELIEARAEIAHLLTLKEAA